MRTFLHYLRLYGLLAGKYIQARMQYRFDFFVSTVGILAGNIATMAAIWVVFLSIPSLGGYSYAQVIFLYAFALLAQSPTQILFDHLWVLRMHTNQGTFIKYYFKPLPTLFYYVSEMVDLKGFGQLAFGIGAFVWASLHLGIEWTPLRIALLPVLLTGGSLIFVSLMVMAAAATFWVKDSFSILAFVSGFRDQARYPMSIFNSFFQFLFTFIVPIAFIAFFPAQFYLGNAGTTAGSGNAINSSSVPDWTAWISPVVGAALFAVAVWVWNRGTRRWGATGS